MMLMDHHAHFDALRTANTELADVAGQEQTAFVRHCHPWRMADLVRHTGVMHRLMVRTVETLAARQGGSAAEESSARVVTPGDAELVDWFRDGAGLLEHKLTELDPDDTLGGANPNRTLDVSLCRHIARETAVHRWDAESAVGVPQPLPAEVAADWLDGLLLGWLPHAAGAGRQAQGPWRGERLAFERTDGPEGWVVTLAGPGDVVAARGSTRADVTVRATASSLLLLAMNRLTPQDDEIVVEGAEELLRRWRVEIRFGSPSAG